MTVEAGLGNFGLFGIGRTKTAIAVVGHQVMQDDPGSDTQSKQADKKAADEFLYEHLLLQKIESSLQNKAFILT
ncbi:MAG TPA: hypothetical protein VG870_04860 [Chitinophagaceae bacterium]|nr:hypothetical protein [Chitinophagaceae bacterium]